MSENAPSASEARSYVREAAEAESDSIFFGDPVRHVEEKIRRAAIVLQATGVERPGARPLWKAQAWPSLMPPSLEAELLVKVDPSPTIVLTTRDLASAENFLAAFAERSGIEVRLDELTGDEPPAEAWPRVATALRWLAIDGSDHRLISRSTKG